MYGQEYSWGGMDVFKMDLFPPLFLSLPQVDNLKCILVNGESWYAMLVVAFLLPRQFILIRG
jgi:hypothetical protein